MKHCLTIVLMLFFAGAVMAQGKTVTGTVTDDSGAAFPGVTVLIKGSDQGTTTDDAGKYKIDVPNEDAILVFSFTGMSDQEKPVKGVTSIDIAMAEGEVLQELVVTALGISRDKKSLGYATQTIDGENIGRQGDVNFMSSLSGQVAGAQIKNSGTMGGSANVIIRGYTSIGGNNQPLYVVDGIPISNDITNGGNQQTGRGGFDYGNAAMDINPQDIESVSVLKGAAASALYGARAANGVILITTKKGKKGKKGIGVTVSTGLVIGTINKNTMPSYQNEYGPGYGQYYGPDTVFSGEVYNGYVEEVDLDGDGSPDDLATPMGEDASYGLAFSEAESLLGWNSIHPEMSTYLQRVPYDAAENDPTTFYEASMMTTNSVAIDGASDKGSYRFAITDMRQKGILPNSRLKRNNASLNVSYDLNEKLSFSSSMQYVNNQGLGRYGTGYDNRNVNQCFRQWYSVNVDMVEQYDAYMLNENNLTWNSYGFSAPESYRADPHYFDNPYYMRYKSYSTDNRDRFIGNVVLNYELNDWLSVMGRITNDSYSELREERIAYQSVDVPSYSKYTKSFYERNYDLFLNFDKSFGANDIMNLTGMVGTNIRRSGVSVTDAETNGGLVVPGIYSFSNSVSAIEAPGEADARRAVDGYLGRATLSYDNFLYLDLSARYDISSTLPEDNNSFFYPAATLSLIYSELLDVGFMDFGKIRFNYAQVGNDAPMQSLQNIYSVGTPFGGTTLSSAPNTGYNSNLLPENTTSIEFGLENKFFNNKLGLDLTFYKANTFNQILAITPSAASGTYYQYVNAGNIENKGVELQLYGNIFTSKSGDFKWDMKVNWAKNTNKVVELTGDLTTYQLASVQGGITIEATVGESYGVIKGSNFVYDEESGEPLVYAHPFGGVRYCRSASPEIIGNMLPDWTGGVTNTFSYKNLSVSALIDIQKGGNFFSLDTWYGYGTGIYDITTGNNSNGVPVRDPVNGNTGGGLDIGGVVAATDATTGAYIYDADGNFISSGVKNEEFAYFGNYANSYGWATAPNALHVYDASYVKLRQLLISYAIPSEKLEGIGIQGLEIGIVGRNLAILYKNCPYTDPEAGLSAGNVQGYQSGAYPAVREIGFNLTFKF